MAAPLIKQAGSRGAGIFAEISKGLGAWLPSIREASKKAGGSSKNKRKRTPGKHRGPKKYEGDYVEPGMVLCRQLGLKYYPGENVGVGRDLTLFALERGHVIMSTEKLSPNPISPLYPAVKAGEEVYKRFFNVIPDSQQQVFKLVTQT